jgi:hypothetical protein
MCHPIFPAYPLLSPVLSLSSYKSKFLAIVEPPFWYGIECALALFASAFYCKILVVFN